MRPFLQYITGAIIAAFLLLMSGCTGTITKEGKAAHAILNLDTAHLKNGITLKGEWAFYWNRQVSPTEKHAVADTFVQFPFLWTGKSLYGQKLPANGFATYAVDVVMPLVNAELGLKIPDTYSSYQLYVNGKLLSSNGKAGTSAANAIPYWNTSIISLPRADTLHILLQVSNFWHTRAGTYKDIVIGEKKLLLTKFEQDYAADLILTGCLFMGGLFLFGLFLFGKHDRAILFFSLFSMLYSYRIMGTDLYAFHHVFPTLSWFVTIRIEYASLFLSIALFAQYTRCLYPKDVYHPLMKGLIGVCLLFTFVTVFFPARIFSQLTTPFLVFMFVYIVYAFMVFIKAFRNKRAGSQYALMSNGVMMLVFLIINLDYFGIFIPHKIFLFSGYILFFFLQSLILSYRFAFELKKAKAEAEQGFRTKSEFLSTMSHEIRTPLNAVIGMTHFLLKNKPREDQKENLDVLLFSANNLLTLVNDILDFNKIEANKISFEQIEFDLATLAGNIINGFKSMANEKGINLQLEEGISEAGLLSGDPTRLGQVMSNLIHNAIKFTDSGMVKLILVAERLTERNATIRIMIKDTGIGIPAEKQKIIFDQFTQADSSTSRSHGGTGLGLSISRRILQLMGSELKLNSAEGNGSEFYFTILINRTGKSKGKSEPINNHANASSTPLKGIRILLAEDNEINVLVANNFLNYWGAETEVAVNGQEAIDKFDPARHHLILMDLHMPGIDGYEATRILRTRGITSPIIALTASIPKEVEDKVIEAGLDGTVIKPFIPEDLLQKILDHLKQN
ncbi:MAG: response regulator [Chitinophagaceae bacterium]|nr:response regulator [Chitinophagaceae bacterium]